MSDINELQARISVAMDRVAAGLDQLSSGGGGADAGQTAELQAALDEERTANAQLEERLRALKQRQAEELSAAQSQVQDTRAKVDTLDLELQRLRQANAQLRESNQALRDANEAGVAEPHLINKSMLAELEALRAARAADVAEASAILSALGPVLAQTSPAAAEESQDA